MALPGVFACHIEPLNHILPTNNITHTLAKFNPRPSVGDNFLSCLYGGYPAICKALVR